MCNHFEVVLAEYSGPVQIPLFVLLPCKGRAPGHLSGEHFNEFVRNKVPDMLQLSLVLAGRKGTCCWHNNISTKSPYIGLTLLR